MKTVLLTSSIGTNYKNELGERVLCKPDNSNGFIDKLKSYSGSKIDKFIAIASDPNLYEITDFYTDLLRKSFAMDNIEINNMLIIDNRYKGNLEKDILSASVVFLCGGHVPTQNAFLKDIGLKEILSKYDGILIGQSAGSMNMASIVYCPPEAPEDFTDGFQRTFEGLGITDIRIMPHMDILFDDNVDGMGKNSIDYCIEDSYKTYMYGLYDGGFVEIKDNQAVSYGKTLLIKNGEITELCANGEAIEISPDYEILPSDSITK